MVKLKTHCQNLAYCRYIHIWCILYFLNIISCSPLISLIVISFFHFLNLKFNSKRICILISDFILIILIYSKNKKLYLFTNLFIFLFYIKILYLININPYDLYLKKLKNDDRKYKKENYLQYLTRIWKLFLQIH